MSAKQSSAAISDMRINGLRAGLEDCRGDVECFDALLAEVSRLRVELERIESLTAKVHEPIECSETCGAAHEIAHAALSPRWLESAASAQETREPPIKSDEAGGLGDVEIARRNGWGVGTRLRGTEYWPGGSCTCVIEITGIGESHLLAKCIDHSGKRETSPESIWTLSARDWRRIDRHSEEEK